MALALIKPEWMDGDGFVRLRHEARSMGRLGDHPHIVTVYDFGEEYDHAYIVSQYMAGGSVEGALRAEGSSEQGIEGSRTEPRSLPLEETLRIGEHICRALEYAHAHGVIHRDLKPANVWFTADGTAKLGDFGLATELSLVLPSCATRHCC